MAELVRAAKTPKGTDCVVYEVLLELQKVAMRENFVLQYVEGYEYADDWTKARMDATFSVPHSEYRKDWNETVHMSVEFATEALSSVADREKLKYKVWFDYK